MEIKQSNLIEVTEQLSRSKFISDGSIDEIINSILLIVTNVLDVERSSIWFISNDQRTLTNQLAYSINQGYYKMDPILEKDSPNYFKHIQSDQILVSNDAYKDPKNFEIKDNYIAVNGIKSMLDVPFRLNGKFTGVFCIETTSKKRNWTVYEQQFVIALAHILTLTILNHENNTNKKSLEDLLEEKTILIKELNHRVKNNLSIILALLKNESHKSKDDFHQNLFGNIIQQVYAISSIHQSINFTENFNAINLKAILTDLLGNIQKSYGNIFQVQIQLHLIDMMVDVKNATSLTLIINEVITNSYKHAFKQNRNNQLIISLSKEGQSNKIIIQDNGDTNPFPIKKGQGTELNDALIEQMDGSIQQEYQEGLITTIIFD